MKEKKKNVHSYTTGAGYSNICGSGLTSIPTNPDPAF
jgi:hypothetical protein